MNEMLQEEELNAILEIYKSPSAFLFLTGSQIDNDTTDGSDVDIIILDPSCHEVLFKTINPVERKLDLTIFPFEKLENLSNPKPNLDTLPVSLTESSVLNAIFHGRQILPVDKPFPYSENYFERASWAVAEGELSLAGAALGSLRRRLGMNDGWSALLLGRDMISRWTDAWLATKYFFVGKIKWRLRFLRTGWPSIYNKYLSTQFPATFESTPDAPVAEALKGIIQYLHATPIHNTPSDKKAEQIINEVQDVYQQYC